MTEQKKTTTIPLPVQGKDMDSIMQSLESGVEELFTSNRYQEFLKTMAKFHNYSFNNTMLIAMQRPDATLVTSYKNWQSMGRQVMKGEKGITIIAPAPYKKMKEKEVLDENQRPIMGTDGKPKTEKVEVTVPHFKAVTVFDIAQTSGEPIQTLAPELLTAAVQDFDSFMQAIQKISPVPIRFDEIDGNANGYYHNADKEIVIKKGLSESQTLKTTIHETAHAKLHDKEIMESLGVEKDRLTKEVEAESVAYCVCSSFGLDTSDYSFPYIAGWSSGRDTKELRSSMDTIRRTASELITGIEEQLQELQRNREVSQEQTKESILLIQNTDLSEFSLLDVYGMDRPELMQALSEMTDDDKLSIQAYLESRGAWTTEIGNQDSREYGEYHLDVRYNTDTDELIDMKERKAVYDKAMEPINADDVVVKFASIFESEWEVLKITNMLRDDVRKMLKDMASLNEKEWDGNYLSYMEKQGAEITFPKTLCLIPCFLVDDSFMSVFEYDSFFRGCSAALF